MVERGGFEPPKAEPADLQSAPFNHSGTSPKRHAEHLPQTLPWSQRRESNPRPTDYKSVALPSELRWRYNFKAELYIIAPIQFDFNTNIF